MLMQYLRSLGRRGGCCALLWMPKYVWLRMVVVGKRLEVGRLDYISFRCKVGIFSICGSGDLVPWVGSCFGYAWSERCNMGRETFHMSDDAGAAMIPTTLRAVRDKPLKRETE